MYEYGKEILFDSFKIAQQGIELVFREILELIDQQLSYPDRIRKWLPAYIDGFEERVSIHLTDFEIETCSFLLKMHSARAFTRDDIVNAKADLQKLIEEKKSELEKKRKMLSSG